MGRRASVHTIRCNGRALQRGNLVEENQREERANDQQAAVYQQPEKRALVRRR